MKFTRNLLSRFIDLDGIDDSTLYKTLNNVGLEVESSRKISIPRRVVVGRVVEKIKHPDADKLNICKVDVGSEVLQIVCGAGNVAKDQFVPVALIGAALEKITIQKTTLRGVESCGMICSAAEIGLEKIENGILVLDSSIGDLALGRELCDFEIFNDTIFEVAITPNRGDCFSLLGIARDLAVALNLVLKNTSEERENSVTIGIGRVLNLSFDPHLHASLYYKVAEIAEISLPLTTKFALSTCATLHQDALANLLEYAFFMSGVLINAYKFDANNQESKINIHIAHEKDGSEGVYCEGERLSVVGISSNEKFAAHERSKFVVFEASYIPPNRVSNVIFSNKSSSGFIEQQNKSFYAKRGSSPLLEEGMIFFCNLLGSVSKSIIYSSAQKLLQEYPQNRIDFRFEDIEKIIGNAVPSEEITNILKKMDFRISFAADNSFIATTPPIYRHDIHSVQDIAEEILRIKGIDTIKSVPQVFTQHRNMDANYALYRFTRDIAKRALAARFFECLHYVFCKKSLLESLGFPTLPKHLDITNPITNDLDTLRTSLLPALLQSVERNANLGFEAIRLFEIGSIYDANRAESKSLSFVASGQKSTPRYPHPKGQPWDFYGFSSAICDIVGDFRLESAAAPALFHPNITAAIIQNGEKIGLIGKINPSILGESLELSEEAFLCEIDFDKLFKNSRAPSFREFSRQQDSRRDLTILLEKNISFAAIEKAILEGGFAHIKNIIPLDVYEGENLDGKVALSLRIIFQAMDKTLSEEELKMPQIAAFLEEKFGAKIR